jgi:hypothetical protein
MGRKVVSVLLIFTMALSIALFASVLARTASSHTTGDPINDPKPNLLGGPIDDPKPNLMGDPINDPRPSLCMADPIDGPRPG